MYVICVVPNAESPAYYLHAFSLGFIELTNSIGEALVLPSSSAAHSLIGAIGASVYNLDPHFYIQCVSVDDEVLVDDSVPFSYSYYFVEV